ncbi:hypothetical protein BKA65DRAFT_111845 [Rhexocercosporidium sp. MPI-PUGE-AT-0058]|nr:hypothetical protein BKA65DRAFT_111845 [Rhexocercosporidium sp. MPI-PUGE-AT-0058]
MDHFISVLERSGYWRNKYAALQDFDGKSLNPGPRMVDWRLAATLAEVRAELKRRGLPQHGDRTEVFNRLETDNDLCWNPRGRYEIHNRKLVVMKAEEAIVKANVTPFTFDWFPKFPLDIQILIWEASLPGPRVLSASDMRNDYLNPDRATMVCFREHDNQPNPVALSVCLESRRVALTRYRLCFGTPNIYADLNSDILYFGSHWRDAYVCRWNEEELPWSPTSPYPAEALEGSLLNDWLHVKRIALRHFMWDTWAQSGGLYAGMGLRRTLKQFVSLEELILVEGGDAEEMDGMAALTPGHIVFHDSTRNPSEDAELIHQIRHGFLQRCFEADLNRKCFEGMKYISEDDFKLEESTNPPPALKFVEQERVTVLPDDDWNRDEGKPFVLYTRSHAGNAMF